MRTKTLVLAAVLSAAGIASSLAQAVYSVNIATNGFPIGDNDVLFTWDVAGQTYNQSLIGQASPAAWLDPVTFNPVVVAPAVGAGFVVNRNSGPTTTWNRSFTIQ